MAKKDEILTFSSLALAVEVGHDGKRLFLIEALDDALAKCATGAVGAGAKASLDLKLIVQPNAKGEVVIGASMKTTLPSPGAFPITAFLDRHGRLVADDPQQETLPFEPQVLEGGEA